MIKFSYTTVRPYQSVSYVEAQGLFALVSACCCCKNQQILRLHQPFVFPSAQIMKGSKAWAVVSHELTMPQHQSLLQVLKFCRGEGRPAVIFIHHVFPLSLTQTVLLITASNSSHWWVMESRTINSCFFGGVQNPVAAPQLKILTRRHELLNNSFGCLCMLTSERICKWSN